MDEVDGLERGSAKRDRTARLMRVASLLNAHPEGMRPKEVGRSPGRASGGEEFLCSRGNSEWA